MPQLALDIGIGRELDSLQKPVKKGVFRTGEKFRAQLAQGERVLLTSYIKPL